MISLKKKFIFIHFPKTGGNSLQNNLIDYSDDEKVCMASHQDGLERYELRNGKFETVKHSTIQDYQNQISAELLDAMFVISAIRNPWDRLISFYFSPHRKVDKWNRDDFLEFINGVKPFEDFVCLARDGKNINRLDFLIRFESLDEDYKKLTNHLDLDYKPLAHRNVSTHKDYRTYYDNELVQLVHSKFQFEIELGNYRF